MAENLYNSAHKATNEPYRDNYDRIFNRILIGPKERYKTIAEAEKNCGKGKTIIVMPK